MAAARILIRHLRGSKANRIEQFPIDACRQLSIGRNPSSTILFDAANDDAVSRNHALIAISPGDPPIFTLSDLNSANGTLRNGTLVSGDSELLPGDEIELGAGGPKFVFDMEPRPGSSTAHTRLLPAVPAPPTKAAKTATAASDAGVRGTAPTPVIAVSGTRASASNLDGILQSGIIVVAISVVCLIFGSLYIKDHPFGFLVGDPAYTLAGWAVGLGFIAFFVGLGLLIAGLVRHNSQQAR